jgi:diguanylate cyclase (GGDEF)-like protein/PAS domain S-box-containing protein
MTIDDLNLKALRVSESRYRRLFETARDGILLLNADTAQIEDVNPYLIEMLGYSHAEFLGKKLWEVGPFADMKQSKEMFAELQSNGYAKYDDLPLKTKSGMEIAVEFVSNSYLCDDIKVIQCNIRNITERHVARKIIQRNAQLYLALSQCNKAIVHCSNADDLFMQVCRTAVECGGMKMAWIGLVEVETDIIRPITSFGDDTQYLKDIKISLDDRSPFGNGPSAIAIRENRPFWCRDFIHNSATKPWHAPAIHAGFVESASLPLSREGLIVGAFTLYASEANAFDESAINLLTEMATDISFALTHLAQESHRKQINEEIQLKNTILKTQMETSLDAILVVGESGAITSYNQHFIALWGLSPTQGEAILDETILQSIKVKVENPDEFIAQVNHLYDHPNEKSRNVILLKDGRIVDRYSSPVVGEDGKYFGRVWYFRDITKRKKAEQRIAYLNRVYAVLSGINGLIVRSHNHDDLFMSACKIACNEGGFRMAWIGILDQPNMTVSLVASAGVNESFVSEIKHLLSSSDASKTMSARAVSEKKVVVSNDSQNDDKLLLRKKHVDQGVRSMVVLPLMDVDQVMGVLVLYATEPEFFHNEELNLLKELAGDIGHAIDHLNKKNQLDYLAYYDQLTGLANQRLFLDRMTQYIRIAVTAEHKLAVFLFDLERFKNINDSFGRHNGDVILQQVSEWLVQSEGSADVFARIGADHFAMFRPILRGELEAAQLIETKMNAFLEHTFNVNDSALRIAAKVGISVFPDDGSDAETLYMNAESALKKAKVSGDNYLFYNQSMSKAAAEKLSMENQLREALDNEEFVLYYQPKVGLAKGEITSVEALIRWNNPGIGLVPPGQFIPILEETGLIYRVGRWALRKAIEDYLRWRLAGLRAVRIAVNVSPLQLRNRSFVDEIRSIITINPHAAEGLELEITESMIMQDINQNIVSLQAIRDLGVTIAIDDFGTGFSSLSSLSKLPVNTLKIDRSFIVEMTKNPEGLALVSMIINLAHALKLNVVAEGVETEEQSRLLHLLSCDQMQGFLFSKPVPSEVLESRFLTNKLTKL